MFKLEKTSDIHGSEMSLFDKACYCGGGGGPAKKPSGRPAKKPSGRSQASLGRRFNRMLPR